MDMEELNYYFKSEKNRAMAQIEESYNEIIKKSTSKFNQGLISKILQYFKDIRVNKIQDLCENELVNPILNNEQKWMNGIDTHLNDLVYSTARDIEASAEESKLSANIDRTISVINATTSFTWINEYINDYLSKLRSFFFFSYESPLFSTSQVEKNYMDLQEELKRYLINEVNKVDSSMKETIKKELDSLRSNYKNQIHEFRNQVNINKNTNMKEFQTIIAMAGLSLINQGHQDYIVDPTTNNLHELDENGRTKDKRFTVLSNKIGEYSIGDSEKNISIISDSLTTRIIDKETNERIKIEYGFDGYEFTINDRKIEDSEMRKEFIIMLFEKYPGVYKHLCDDPFLGEECISVISKNNESKNTDMSLNNVNASPESLLDELDNEEPVNTNEQAFIGDTEKSIDDEIFELEQNPIVQRYLELKKQQEEHNTILHEIL